jgi:hypothetical protein
VLVDQEQLLLQHQEPGVYPDKIQYLQILQHLLLQQVVEVVLLEETELLMEDQEVLVVVPLVIMDHQNLEVVEHLIKVMMVEMYHLVEVF